MGGTGLNQFVHEDVRALFDLFRAERLGDVGIDKVVAGADDGVAVLVLAEGGEPAGFGAVRGREEQEIKIARKVGGLYRRIRQSVSRMSEPVIRLVLVLAIAFRHRRNRKSELEEKKPR